MKKKENKLPMCNGNIKPVERPTFRRNRKNSNKTISVGDLEKEIIGFTEETIIPMSAWVVEMGGNELGFKEVVNQIKQKFGYAIDMEQKYDTPYDTFMEIVRKVLPKYGFNE